MAPADGLSLGKLVLETLCGQNFASGTTKMPKSSKKDFDFHHDDLFAKK